MTGQPTNGTIDPFGRFSLAMPIVVFAIMLLAGAATFGAAGITLRRRRRRTSSGALDAGRRDDAA
jgi:hypothetical protein